MQILYLIFSYHNQKEDIKRLLERKMPLPRSDSLIQPMFLDYDVYNVIINDNEIEIINYMNNQDKIEEIKKLTKKNSV